MPANILNFDADLPEVIYWDSSFTVNFCVEGVKYHSACAGFVKTLEDENILSIVSNLALDEVWYALLRVNLINDFEQEWHEKLRNEPEIINKYVPILRRATADILMLSNVIVVEIPTNFDFTRVEGINVYTCNPKSFGVQQD